MISPFEDLYERHIPLDTQAKNPIFERLCSEDTMPCRSKIVTIHQLVSCDCHHTDGLKYQ